MSPHKHPHRAVYDENGNIIILPDDGAKSVPVSSVEEFVPIVPTQRQTRAHSDTHQIDDVPGWTVDAIDTPDQPIVEEFLPITPHRPHAVRSIATHTNTWVNTVLEEGIEQVQSTKKDAAKGWLELVKEARDMTSQARSYLVRFPAIARKPITLGKRKRLKPRSRLTLFMIDTLRFGGTFAVIFLSLFAALNYQSFTEIVKADLALGDTLKSHQALAQIIQNADERQLTQAKPFQTKTMLDYLPTVGPPDSRIVIPALGISAPVVEPPTDALEREDWKQFEADIQAKLLQGVVLYPGSARPGHAGNTFFTGHSSYYPFVQSDYKSIFALLGKLKVGDMYSVYYHGDQHTYRVFDISVVKPSNVSVLDQPTDKRISTLMTCTPVGTTLNRLIVQAEEIDPATGEILKVGEKTASEKTKLVKLDQLPI